MKQRYCRALQIAGDEAVTTAEWPAIVQTTVRSFARTLSI